MPVLTPRRALACAETDPLVRRHLVIAALSLQAAGVDPDEAELIRQLEPRELEAVVRERLWGHTAELVLRYLHALTPVQCRCLTKARNRLELELEA